MALRDQPYLPLYVQDYLTDEKLNNCCAATQGIYVKLMCIMHKSDEYGCILLEQKFKQTDNQIKNYAIKIAKQLPFSVDEIFSALSELKNEKVIYVNEEKLWQKRMVKDNEISLKRANAGKEGGKKTQFAKAKPKAKIQAKTQANSEYENEYENENKSAIKNKIKTKIILPFQTENFINVWSVWKDYKKREHRFTYKTEISEQAALNKLDSLSNHNEKIAIEIIKQSIENGYKGFFELKNGSKISKDMSMQNYKQQIIDEINAAN